MKKKQSNNKTYVGKIIDTLIHEFPDFDSCEDPIEEHMMMLNCAEENTQEDNAFCEKYLGQNYNTIPLNILVDFDCDCGSNRAINEFVFTNKDKQKQVSQYTCCNCRKTVLEYIEFEDKID
jgi:hypothetical protein